MYCLFLNKFGLTEIILVVIFFLLFFVARKIPEMARGKERKIKGYKESNTENNSHNNN